MIEEACEAAEAMDGDDGQKIADELGDVLLQVVLNSCIGAEHRDFTDRDVTSMASRKMISRHEHVFGKASADSAGAVTAVWENAKKKERGEQTVLERVQDVPVSLPALMRAQKIMRRMRQGGIGTQPQQEMAAAMAGAAGGLGGDKLSDERLLGPLLLTACAYADEAGVDAECALRAAVAAKVDDLKQKKA